METLLKHTEQGISGPRLKSIRLETLAFKELLNSMHFKLLGSGLYLYGSGDVSLVSKVVSSRLK